MAIVYEMVNSSHWLCNFTVENGKEAIDILFDLYIIFPSQALLHMDIYVLIATSSHISCPCTSLSEKDRLTEEAARDSSFCAN